jgi:AcrR family transcriptional regulator
MPRIVDHEERRAEVAAAVWRIVSRDGLEAATVRRVAAETGMSTSVVSHYFAGKDDLLRLAFRIVVERGRNRAIAESASGSRARALLVTGLPLDAERLAEARVWFAFLGLAVTRPDLAAEQRRAYTAWRGAVAAALVEEGLREGLDPDAEAAGLIALVDGLTVQATFAPRRITSARQLALVNERLSDLGVG